MAQRISFWRLFRLLSANRRVAMRRHPLVEKNLLMRVLWSVLGVIMLVYLAVIGGVLGWELRDATRYEGYDVINGGMVFLLMMDFLLRFAFFETPANEMKPYKLLPIGVRSLLLAYLLRIVASGFNFIWWAFLIPFGVFTVVPDYGVPGFAGWLLGWWLLFVGGGLWYLFWRTLITRRALWLLVPVLFYGLSIWLGLFFPPFSRFLFTGCMELGRGFCTGALWAFALPLVLAGALLWLNMPLQHRCAYDEIAMEGTAQRAAGGRFGWLDRFGVYGEYIKLDLRSMLRNKVVRQQHVVMLWLTLSLCALNAFTEAYDGAVYQHFIIFYCFALAGSGPLSQLLCPEGNYIDMLLSRRESVHALLRAKFLLYSLVMLVPLLLLLVPVLNGKFSFLDSLASCLFTAGVYYPVMFQCAVYNNRTLPLNDKFTRTQSSTKSQLLISLAACFLPMVVIGLLYGFLPALPASLILGVVGLVGIGLSHWWIRSVYDRFMVRRHVNMEGFRASRHTL